MCSFWDFSLLQANKSVYHNFMDAGRRHDFLSQTENFYTYQANSMSFMFMPVLVPLDLTRMTRRCYTYKKPQPFIKKAVQEPVQVLPCMEILFWMSNKPAFFWRETLSLSSNTVYCAKILEKLVWSKAFIVLAYKICRNMKGPVEKSLTHDFPFLIGYYMRYNINRFPDYYNSCSHIVTPQGKCKPQLCSSRLGNCDLQFNFYAILVTSICIPTSLLLDNFPRYVWKLYLVR